MEQTQAVEKQPDNPKARKVYPKKLMPPPEVLKLMIEKRKRKLPKNKFLRFLKLFFGEGI